MDETALWILLALGGLLALALAFFLLRWIWWGAFVLFNWAAEQAFLGVIAYAAAWVFLFPLMLAASLIVGVMVAMGMRHLQQAAKEDDRYRWANRLPPCDNED